MQVVNGEQTARFSTLQRSFLAAFVAWGAAWLNRVFYFKCHYRSCLAERVHEQGPCAQRLF